MFVESDVPVDWSGEAELHSYPDEKCMCAIESEVKSAVFGPRDDVDVVCVITEETVCIKEDTVVADNVCGESLDVCVVSESVEETGDDFDVVVSCEEVRVMVECSVCVTDESESLSRPIGEPDYGDVTAITKFG